MMKKLRCGNISFAKVALKRARKYCIKSRARKCANKSFRYSLSEPKPFAKNQYIQNIKKVLSCVKYVSGKTGCTWKCTAKCKALTQFEVDTVLEFKSYFEKSLHDVI